jgi:UDP-glucose 4-epimerase
VRYFNAYGPGQRPAYVVSRTVHRALNGRPLLVYDGGRQTRCFTYVADAVAGTVLAADRAEAVGQAFNLGSTQETTVAEIVNLVAKLTGYDGPIVPIDTGAALGTAYEDLPRRVPRTDKARTLLGWEPTVSLRDGLTRTVEWAAAHPGWLALPDQGAG